MPVIKQAIKKVRQDKRKTKINVLRKSTYKRAVSTVRKSPSADTLKAAYKALDKAAKTNIIHRNKASRLKSRLSKLLKSPVKTQPTKKS